MGLRQGEESQASEEGIRPASMVLLAAPEARTLLAFTQTRPQAPAHEAIEPRKGPRRRVLKVLKPAPQHRVQLLDDLFQRHRPGTPGPLPDAVLQRLQALAAHRPPPTLEPVAQELKPLPRLQTVAHVRLVRMQPQAIRFDPPPHPRQRRLGLRLAAAEDHKVVRIPHQSMPGLLQRLIQPVQVEIRQQRAQDSCNTKGNLQATPGCLKVRRVEGRYGRRHSSPPRRGSNGG